jgi:hypothetical protein
MKKLARLVAATAAAAFALTAGAPGAHAGPNLAPNPSFEVSVLEPASPAIVAAGQPVLPDGWAFEGVAGLFDYPDQRCIDASGSFPCRRANSGNRFIAVSDPLSGPVRQCVGQIGQCVDNPAYAAMDVAAFVYSGRPVWRNVTAIPVNGGQGYVLSAAVSWELMTEGTGAYMAVRWVDATGVPIQVDRIPTPAATPTTQHLDWTGMGGGVTAPPNAAGAILLLGHTGDAWISQVRFDDVFFG